MSSCALDVLQQFAQLQDFLGFDAEYSARRAKVTYEKMLDPNDLKQHRQL